jgi:hypothetical protein
VQWLVGVLLLALETVPACRPSGLIWPATPRIRLVFPSEIYGSMCRLVRQ